MSVDKNDLNVFGERCRSSQVPASHSKGRRFENFYGPCLLLAGEASLLRTIVVLKKGLEIDKMVLCPVDKQYKTNLSFAVTHID